MAAAHLTTDSIWYEFRNSVFSRQFAHAENLLNANPSLFEQCNSIGETVLHFLAVENDLEAVKWLHARGFSLNVKNRFGQPMVFEVASLGHKELILWLAENGADLFIKDKSNWNIFEYLRRSQDESRRTRSDEMAHFLLKHVESLRSIGDTEG